MRLLIGTNNPSKLRGTRQMMAECAPEIECVSPAELGLTDVQPDENGRTAIDNARSKALAWHEASGLPVIAEDSGLIFLDLPADHPDQPGVRVRRMNGSDWMDDETMLVWYADIARRHGGELRACWQDAWCIVDARGQAHVYQGPDELLELYAFHLVDTPSQARTAGWPLDSLTVYPQLGRKYIAELTDEDTHRLAAKWNETAQKEQARHYQWIRDVLVNNARRGCLR